MLFDIDNIEQLKQVIRWFDYRLEEEILHLVKDENDVWYLPKLLEMK